MNILKSYAAGLLAAAAILAAAFGISKYYAEEMAVPVISYAAAEVTAENVVSSGAVDINSASAEELLTLDGIGPSTADKIISYREKHGGFGSVRELLEVDGIGEAKLAAIENMITVSGSSFTEAASSEIIRSGEAVQTEEDFSGEEAYAAALQSAGTVPAETVPENIYPININTASEEELMLLEGVGEVIAGRIREYAENTGFKSVDELIEVKGIGEKKLEAIRPYVTV